jgi:O-antigen ligase
MGNFNTLVYKFFLLIFPLSLITGPFIPELIILLIIGCSSRHLVLKKNFYLYQNNFFKILTIISLFIIIRNYFSDYFYTNHLNSLFYFRFAIFALCIFFLDLNNEKFKKYLFYGIIFTFLLLITDSLYENFNGERIYGVKSIYEDRISSYFGDEYIMGSYVVRLSPLLIFSLLWINIKSIYFYFILNLILLVSFILIIMSGERTALLLFSIILLYFVFLRKFRFFFLINLIFISIITFYIFQNSNFEKRFLHSFNKNFIENKELIFFTEEHHSMMITSLKIAKSNIYFGTGGKSFSHMCKKDEFKTITYPNNDTGNEDIGCSSHPHNIILQILVEYGLVGVVIFLIIFFKVTQNLYLNIKKFNSSRLPIYKNQNLSKIFLYISIFINIFPLIPSGSFFNNWFSILLYLPIGFILSLEKK